MIELIRNCTHGSDVAVYVVNDAERLVRKCSYTPEGIADLLREARGWEWYASKRYHRQQTLYRINVRQGYARLELEWIEGTKGDLRGGLIGNRDLIHQAIQHYCSVWSECEGQQVPLHGDLSVDNILLNANGVHILDWEHFDPKGGFWGFDALYLICETLWFGIQRHGRPVPQELLIAAEALRLLATSGKVSEDIINNPMKKAKDFIKVNYHLWGPQLMRFPMKLPITSLSDDQAIDLDKQINQFL